MAVLPFWLAVICAVNSALVSCCPNGWVTYGNSCYHVSRDKASWNEAQRMCEGHGHGSFLAHIETEPEDRFIQALLRNSQHGIDFWMSGADWTRQWLWEPEGTPMLYTHWAPDEPNNIGSMEHCLAIRYIFGYQWTDADCRNKFHYVCEQTSSPEVMTTKEALVTDTPV